MQKFTAGCLLGVAFLFFTSAACFIGNGSLGEKHVGQVTVRNEGGSGLFEFIRPSGEFFEMKFDPHYLAPNIHKGDVLADLVYTDQKNHEEFFIKATLVSEASKKPTSAKMLYERSTWYNGLVCNGSSCEVQPSPEPTTEFYLWKDGGYREKPEPKK